MLQKNLSDFINSVMVSEDSVISQCGLLEAEPGVKDILQIF